MTGYGARGTGGRVLVRSQVNRLVVAVTFLVMLPLVAVTERVREGAGRRMALRVVRALARACSLRVDVVGGSELTDEGSYVFVPNHRSHLDIVVMFLARPSVRFVAAKELFRIPLLAGTMRALDTVAIDRKDLRAARRQLASITPDAQHGSIEVVVYAEGGIVPAGEEWPFKTGAIVLALDNDADLVPVAITGAADVAPPGSRLTVRPGAVRVELLPPISTRGRGRADRKALRGEVEDSVRRALG